LLQNFPQVKDAIGRTACPKKDEYYYIRISHGCPGKCSYCAIRKAIGPIKSKPIDECLSEFKKGIQKGYKNIMLTADDTGAYGIDIHTDFPTLLNTLLQIKGTYILHIGDSNPRWVNRYQEQLKKIFLSEHIKQFIVPIQSASKKVLTRMHRDTNIDTTKQILLDIKKTRPDLLIETHVIIGYPRETERDLDDTLHFIQDVGFSSAWIYRFAAKTETEAAESPNQIPVTIVDKRIQKAGKLFTKLGIQYNKQS